MTVQAEEESGVGPHTYTLASSQALCVCVLFMPLLRHCAVWNKGPIWALLPPEAVHLAAMANQSTESGVIGTPQQFYKVFTSFTEERLLSCICLSGRWGLSVSIVFILPDSFVI